MISRRPPALSLFAAVLLTATGCTQPESVQTLPTVVLRTHLGDILVEVDTVSAPITSANFLRYVDESRMDSAHFYRVVTLDNQPNNDVRIEVIQGGLGNRAREMRLDAIAHETTETTGLRHTAGALSMARLQPGTASSEFFICVTDQPELDFGGRRNPDGQGFAVFGRVVEGMDVVKAIQLQPAEGQTLTVPVEISDVRRESVDRRQQRGS